MRPQRNLPVGGGDLTQSDLRNLNKKNTATYIHKINGAKSRLWDPQSIKTKRSINGTWIKMKMIYGSSEVHSYADRRVWQSSRSQPRDR